MREAYRLYSRVLNVAADQKTRFASLHLGSLFARVDYLSRQYHLDRQLTRRVNDTRVRLRRVLAIDDATLTDCRLYDLRAICEFIAAIYEAEVPADLRSLFPADQRPATDSSVVADSIRLYVRRCDDVYLYGTCAELADEEELRVCYCYKGGSGDGDNAYLRPYLRPGTQVNLVQPRLCNGVYFPELVILEPDYLVDITTVTSCFEDYGYDARIALLGRLQAAEDSVPIMLGNLAGQLLDEEVHSAPTAEAYAQSYASFLRANAFRMLVTVSDDTLYNEGRSQQSNIHRALQEGLQQRVGSFDRTQAVLEPSFVCEMLGLQGRMDFLQLDGRVLIEQKSGKGEWVRGARPDDPPHPRLPHYIQVLLYQAILHYGHGIPNREIQLLLLYSRYSNGLIGVTPAPQLLHEALRIRNRIAGNEFFFCRGHYTMLQNLLPEQLLTRQVNPRFWQEYKLPGIRSVLDPIRQATPLARAYFLRFMTFLANEHMLSKLGNRTKESSGFAAKWHDSLEQKYQAGNIYDQLTLVYPGPDHQGSVSHLVFAFAAHRASEMSDFRVGDIVIAYQYAAGTEPDVRRAIVMRGSITEIGQDTLHIELRAAQSDRRVLDTGNRWPPSDGSLRRSAVPGNPPMLWAVEHDFMEATYKSQYSGLHALLTAPSDRRDLLLLQRSPRIDSTLAARGSYGSFQDLATRVRQARDFFLIIGPPGTGKTSYGMLYTLQEQLLDPGSRVLVMSFTNRAVDEICSKLIEERIDFVRIGNPYTCSSAYRSYTLNHRLAEASSLTTMRQLLDQTRVVVGTTTTLSSSAALFQLMHFDLAIIDEASQILEPHLMGLLSAQTPDHQPAMRRFVMIGDHKQLPAVVQQDAATSEVCDPQLRAIGLTDCRLSLFERLLTRYRHDPQVVYMLTRQGRMHQDIADWPNRMFYGGHLQVVPLQHQTAPTILASATANLAPWQACTMHRVAWLDVPVAEPVVADKVNLAEARVIALMVMHIYATHTPDFDPLMTVGVIVPYRNQIAAVRNAIDTECHRQGIDPVASGLFGITIDTVERYQGSQRDYIIYGLTVQRSYQLTFLTNNTFEEDGVPIDRKLNVAMTRARQHLIMVGNSALMCQAPLYADLLNYITSRGGYLRSS